MTTLDWLTAAQQTLQDHHIDSARLDALILLEDQIGRDRAWLLAHPEHVLEDRDVASLQILLNKRTDHQPMAYIRGHQEFYGRSFTVNEHVLVPRPESETIIELLIAHAAENEVIADIGTGSGALGITAQLELPDSTVYVTDIDEACLALACDNAERLGAHVTPKAGDLLTALEGDAMSITTLLCNLPYVPLHYPINTAATHEPELALFSGEDGLDAYRLLFEQLQNLAMQPKLIVCESLESQHAALTKIAATANYKPRETRGLIQAFVLA